MVVWRYCQNGSFVLVFVARFEFLMAVNILWGVMCSLVVRTISILEELLPASWVCDTEGSSKMLASIYEVIWHCFPKYHNVDICSCFFWTIMDICLCNYALWRWKDCAFKPLNLCFWKQFWEVINLSIQFCFQLGLTV